MEVRLPTPAPSPAVTTRSVDRRYAAAEVLGVGGMGEVLRATDRFIGRDVAVKVVRSGASSSRLLREARVQAQLEHPAIVPIYDIGVDDDGDAYFTMRRVRGMTLAGLLRALARNDEAMRERYPVRQRLAAFSKLCLALHFAHTRGVVHRDLKPANVMIGDFGEVYVLDWGLARIDPASALADDALEDEVSDADCLGTPGYMAPEQIEGEAVDARADVYALGVILFELLTLTPFHPGSPDARLFSTLDPVDEDRLRAVPRALRGVVARAVARSRGDRYLSARALSDAVERFLHGPAALPARTLRALPVALLSVVLGLATVLASSRAWLVVTLMAAASLGCAQLGPPRGTTRACAAISWGGS